MVTEQRQLLFPSIGRNVADTTHVEYLVTFEDDTKEWVAYADMSPPLQVLVDMQEDAIPDSSPVPQEHASACCVGQVQGGNRVFCTHAMTPWEFEYKHITPWRRTLNREECVSLRALSGTVWGSPGGPLLKHSGVLLRVHS